MNCEAYHIPVLLKDSIDGLDLKAGGIYVDVTFGGGGHSREILRVLGDKENMASGVQEDKETLEHGNVGILSHLYSFDQDADAEVNAGIEDDRFTFVRSNFRYLKNWMRYYGVKKIDGLLADLGVSSHHFDDETRGFSFRYDAPLDMRMNKRAGQTAADIVNEYDEERLADVFYLYGELKNARKLAALLVKARQKRTIATTHDFINAVRGNAKPQRRKNAEPQSAMAESREKKELAKMFQALRIEVNHEMDALKDMLHAATALIKPGGRLSVITYHSLEDRMVKNVMKTGNPEGKRIQDFYGRIETPYTLVNLSTSSGQVRKVIVPSDEEQQRNPRSRSAKLRIAVKN